MNPSELRKTPHRCSWPTRKPTMASVSSGSFPRLLSNVWFRSAAWLAEGRARAALHSSTLESGSSGTLGFICRHRGSERSSKSSPAVICLCLARLGRNSGARGPGVERRPRHYEGRAEGSGSRIWCIAGLELGKQDPDRRPHARALSHCFFSDQRLHQPGPNLNWRLRIRCTSSKPARVTAAVL
jgi:hypothetical protein